MVELKCDKCKKDCGLNAVAVKLENIHNPSPTYPKDFSEPKLSDSHERIQFLLCQDCAREMGLPNLYTSYSRNEVVWRDDEEEE